MTEQRSTEKTLARLKEALGAVRWNTEQSAAMVQAHIDKHAPTEKGK